MKNLISEKQKMGYLILIVETLTFMLMLIIIPIGFRFGIRREIFSSPELSIGIGFLLIGILWFICTSLSNRCPSPSKWIIGFFGTGSISFGISYLFPGFFCGKIFFIFVGVIVKACGLVFLIEEIATSGNS